MLDFIFRFNILNTAFSVIGKEIGEKLGSLGGRWFRCLYIWTLYFFISEWRNNVVYTQVKPFLLNRKSYNKRLVVPAVHYV